MLGGWVLVITGSELGEGRRHGVGACLHTRSEARAAGPVEKSKRRLIARAKFRRPKMEGHPARPFLDVARNAADASVTRGQVQSNAADILDASQNVAAEDAMDSLTRLREEDRYQDPRLATPTDAPRRAVSDPSGRSSAFHSHYARDSSGDDASLIHFEEVSLRDASDFARRDSMDMKELARLNASITKELARGDLAGRSDAADLDSAVEQDNDAVFQNIWTYGAIAVVITCLGFGSSDVSFLQLLALFAIAYVTVSLTKGYFSSVLTRARTAIVSGKPLLASGAAIMTLIFGLIVFGVVTVAMSRITPLLREGGLVLTSFLELICIPVLIQSTWLPMCVLLFVFFLCVAQAKIISQ